MCHISCFHNNRSQWLLWTVWLVEGYFSEVGERGSDGNNERERRGGMKRSGGTDNQLSHIEGWRSLCLWRALLLLFHSGLGIQSHRAHIWGNTSSKKVNLVKQKTDPLVLKYFVYYVSAYYLAFLCTLVNIHPLSKQSILQNM